MKRILLATDLAPRTDRAMERAVQLCQTFGASLTALYAIRDGADRSDLDHLPPHHIEAEIRRHLDRVPGGTAISATTLAVRGPVDEVVADHAALWGADLLVAGHTAPADGPFSLTTIERIGVASPVPLLAVAARPFGRYAGALVAIDFGPASRRAVETALALIPDGIIELLHVCDLPGLDRSAPVDAEALAADFDALLDGLPDATASAPPPAPPPAIRLITRRAMAGAPVPSILRAARENDQTQVIVMATAGRVGVGRALLGSTAHDVLERLPGDALSRDILLVPPPL